MCTLSQSEIRQAEIHSGTNEGTDGRFPACELALSVSHVAANAYSQGTSPRTTYKNHRRIPQSVRQTSPLGVKQRASS